MNTGRTVLEKMSKDDLINLVQMHEIIRDRHVLDSGKVCTISGRTNKLSSKLLKKVEESLAETLDELNNSKVRMEDTNLRMNEILNDIE